MARQRHADAGAVTEPDDLDGFADAVAKLMVDPPERDRMGANARRFAETTFDIDVITDRFEAVLEPAADLAPVPARRQSAAEVA